MWPHKLHLGNEGSDQCISDEEEDEEFAWPQDVVSLAGTLDHKKDGLGKGVASQLELLKGFSSEDEVEMPDFHDKSNLERRHNVRGKSISLKTDGSACEVDEQISKYEGSKMLFNSITARATVSDTLDLYTRRKGKPSEPCSGSTVDRASRGPVNVDENSSCSAHHPSITKDKDYAIVQATAAGGKGKSKSTPASHFQPHKEEFFWHSVNKGENRDSTTDDELLDEPEALDFHLMDKATSELLGGSEGEKTSEFSHAFPVEAVIQHGHSRNSMVELLDDLRGKSSNFHFKPKMGGRRKVRTGRRTVIRSVSSSQKHVTGDEDPCEIVNSGSSMDEKNTLKEGAQNKKDDVAYGTKSMADKFQEAFDSAVVDSSRPSFIVSRQSSTGLFGRLQQVMQRQKEQDIEFAKKLQAEFWPKDEARCIDVKILSRSFDAKLSVCRCALVDNEESTLENPQQENFGKIWTIIFNSRVCGDVDLEVANLVRVHPPWKEVQVMQDGEIIILASYFSQIYN